MVVKQMGIGFFIVIISTIALLAPAAAAAANSTTEYNYSGEDLNLSRFYLDRSGFETTLTAYSAAPDAYSNDLPPAGVKEITYDSGNLKLKAWISEKPADDQKHPAVVYAHGGFSFGGRAEWPAAQQFADRGFIAMTPMLRAENGNPGYFEYFYGEVDDLIAAGEYLANVSYVDQDRIFLFGHSAGGTLSMLVSMMPSKYRAIASSGGSPDQDEFFFEFGYGDIAPFDLTNRSEVILRSPTAYSDSVRTPLFLYVGDRDVSFQESTEEFVRKVNESGGYSEMHKVKGDHFSSLREAIMQSIEKFNSYV